MQDNIKELLIKIGEDPSRQGLINTPKRVEEAMKFLTSGYDMDARKVIKEAIFEEKCDEMIILKDIDIFSMCEHHMMPFFGKCHVAYIPNNRVVGLSKIPRIVNIFARRLQVQERLTNQIADTLSEALMPLGVAVVIEAFHLCMAMRGVEKQNAVTLTSSMLGIFRTDRGTRSEFMSLIKDNIGRRI